MGAQDQEDSTAAPPARKKPQKTSKEVQFAVLPDKYEPLIEEVEEEEEQETEEERRKRKEEKKSRKKRKYKKYRKVSGTFDLRAWGAGSLLWPAADEGHMTMTGVLLLLGVKNNKFEFQNIESSLLISWSK